jgi:hypothetical protein
MLVGHKILFIYSKRVSRQIASPIHTKCYADLTGADCGCTKAFSALFPCSCTIISLPHNIQHVANYAARFYDYVNKLAYQRGKATPP